MAQRAKDHNGRDQHSHLVKHAIENNHLPVKKGGFIILDSGYRNNTRKTKIAGVLIIKVITPSVNAKENSVKSKLSNRTSTLYTNVFLRPILETLHWMWGLSKLDINDTTV